MTAIGEALRAAVAERAGHRCEYCHISATAQVGRFPIDHIIPRTKARKGILSGKTACGRATIARLQLNQPELVRLRELLAVLGLFPELVL